ncbi:MAG: hypothetical protein QOF58_3264, partial [Pseudonocardiales bacterium]|nr:hypothetical protein [Pseudonocardiales bacterium]
VSPFWPGRWDDEISKLDDVHANNVEAAAEFYAEGALDRAAIRAALKTLDVPTLLLVGEVDIALPLNRAREYAELFPHVRFVIQKASGHAPWLDDSEAFATAISAGVQRIP